MDEDLEANGVDTDWHLHVYCDAAQCRYSLVASLDAVGREVGGNVEGERIGEVKSSDRIFFCVMHFQCKDLPWCRITTHFGFWEWILVVTRSLH